MKQAYERIRLLDERLTHKIRGSRSGFTRPGVEQLDERLRQLSEYTLELKEIVEQLFVAIGSRPRPPADPGE